MNKLKLWVIAIGIGAIVPAANAGILIEPYVGYHTGKFKMEDATADVNGMVFGGRLAFMTAAGLFIGADYMAANMSGDVDGADVDAKVSDVGVVVGFEAPVLVRVYGVFSPMAKTTVEGNTTDWDFEGTSLKIGVGFKFLPILAVNLEMYNSTVEYETNGVTIDGKANTFGLTVSLPFSPGG